MLVLYRTNARLRISPKGWQAVTTNPREQALAAQQSLSVKRSEPKINPDNVWGDDLLAREQIAERLTNLVAVQEPPLTVSLHGEWGTGKTFMLQRWQKDLEKKGYRAIYFNAWEDDFCDDPLLAIIGQLSDHFQDGRLKKFAQSVADAAVPLIAQNAGNLLKMFGLPVDLKMAGRSDRAPMSAYHEQRVTKDRVKSNLSKLASSVADETEHPLVFIVDELDRCRPTFAIELLERIKHIFDVPHLVFVFGINRDELCKSLSSLYGDIRTDVYLRRFFDFEFNLPEMDSSSFAQHLINSLGLQPVFEALSKAANDSGPNRDYDNFQNVIPRLWNGLGLSLRDIDYGIRLLALLTRNIPIGAYSQPFLLALLIAMKFKHPRYYQSLVTGRFKTKEIVDYVANEVDQRPVHERLGANLDRIEGFLHCAEHASSNSNEAVQDVLTELQSLVEGRVAKPLKFVSTRAQTADEKQYSRIRQATVDGLQLNIDQRALGYLATLIDTYQGQLRL